VVAGRWDVRASEYDAALASEAGVRSQCPASLGSSYSPRRHKERAPMVSGTRILPLQG
jgi:hypothetical protein